MKIKLTGTPNLGECKQRTEEFTVLQEGSSLIIKDATGKILLSVNPFFNGGSIWLSDFSHIIMDQDIWHENSDGKYVKQWTQSQAIDGASTGEIVRWKDDAEKLAKIREARSIIMEVEQ